MSDWWQPYVVSIGNVLAGEALADADRALDEVRHFTWCSHFACLEGAAGVRMNEDASPLAKAIAQELQGLTFAQANEVIGRIRLACWEGSYSRRRGGSGVASDAAASSSTPPH